MASPVYERLKLRNGLRVVLAPDRSAPVVAAAVYYDVGIRSEPEGRTGFAHLFEHLMFQGSASLAKMDHVKYVQSSGGTLNGSTRLDYTNYFEALPSNAHNGYGGFEDLESATVEDARDFFDRYYAPGNAVLAVGGDLDPDEAMVLVERHFGDVA